METLMIIAAVGTLNIACFLIGVNVGQKTSKGEMVEITVPDPMQAIKDHRERKEAEREETKMEVILANVENYDGTGMGQQDVPV